MPSIEWLDNLSEFQDKLLTTLEKNESDIPTSQDDECVICCNAKASMQTYPCGHRVVCRKCFVKTIQSAVSQRLLPLRCVICRSKILRLKQNSSGGSGISERMRTSKSWSAFSTSFSANVPSSASQYSMSSGSSKLNVPTSHSLYSVNSGASLFSGVSSVSSATTSSFGTSCSGLNSRSSGSTIVRSKSLQYPRQPTGSLRRSQMSSMKNRLQEFREPIKEMEQKYDTTTKLTPIQEFQREYRAGREISNSTRIRCAQKIITQLEVTPLSKQQTQRVSRINAPLPDHQKQILKRQEVRSQTLSCKREKENVPICSTSRKYSVSMSRKSNIDSKELDKIEPACSTSDKTKNVKDMNEKTKEKDSKPDKKTQKELSKAEKKQLKKQAKAEKKRLKEEAKRLAKENKHAKK